MLKRLYSWQDWRRVVDRIVAIGVAAIALLLVSAPVASSVAFIEGILPGIFSRYTASGVLLISALLIFVRRFPPLVVLALLLPLFWLLFFNGIFLLITADRAKWPVAAYLCFVGVLLAIYIYDEVHHLGRKSSAGE